MWLARGLASILFLFSASDVLANERKVYRIGVEDVDYLPLMSSRQDGSYQGVIVDILEGFAQEAGLTFQYIPLPITRFDTWYKQDDIDFRFPDHQVWQPDKKEGLFFSVDVIEMKQQLVILRKNEQLRASQVSRIGTLYGFSLGHYWQVMVDDRKLNVISDPSMSVLVRMLFNESLQGLDLEIAVVKHYAKQLNLDPDRLTYAKNIPTIPLHYRLSTKRHTQVLNQFNEYVTKHRATIDEISNRAGLSQ